METILSIKQEIIKTFSEIINEYNLTVEESKKDEEIEKMFYYVDLINEQKNFKIRIEFNAYHGIVMKYIQLNLSEDKFLRLDICLMAIHETNEKPSKEEIKTKYIPNPEKDKLISLQNVLIFNMEALKEYGRTILEGDSDSYKKIENINKGYLKLLKERKEPIL